MEKLFLKLPRNIPHGTLLTFVFKRFAFIKQIQKATLKKHNTSTQFVSLNAEIKSVQDLTNIHLQGFQSV